MLNANGQALPHVEGRAGPIAAWVSIEGATMQWNNLPLLKWKQGERIALRQLTYAQ